ncbi:helix-turn-helix domain-containing protein [Rhodococcus sp. NPDC077669]|uniref:helix-turn-helix domain-containing protein n=1 Tax=Rhodococcus sp. NPDC077669 TaxID=3155174 RepID=UPI00342C890E
MQRTSELVHSSSETDTPALTTAKKREATRMRNQGSVIGDIADVLGVSKRTLYRHFEKSAKGASR